DLLAPAPFDPKSETGFSVAIDGDTAAVAALAYDSRGAVFIYKNVSDTSTPNWTFQAKIQAADIQSSDQFGFSVGLSGDSLIVGAPGKANNAGAVYLFQRLGDSWTQKNEFSGTANAGLGTSVAVFGGHAAAGEPGDNKVFFYDFNGVTWTSAQSITATGNLVGGFGT